MRDDRRNNDIVSGPELFRWPWSRARDVEIGDKARQFPPASHSKGGESTVSKPRAPRPPGL